jgi:hypothetical protein
MKGVAIWLALAIVVSLAVAIILMSRGRVIWGLLSAGACGAFVSVISKLPALTVHGEDSAPYKRGIFRRLCTGLAASVIGVGFLASGIVTITLPQGGRLPDIIDRCGTSGCKAGSVLTLVAVVILFGLSERALTSFEDRVFPGKS